MTVNPITRLHTQFDNIIAPAKLNGTNPWDIQVHEPVTMMRAALRGSLGLGEAYMEGIWDCQAIDDLFAKLPWNMPQGAAFVARLRSMLFTGSKSAAYAVGKRHYSIGNDLYKKMLDKRLTYTCGVWDGATNLDEAQENKLALTAKKMDIEPGMRVLDIGSGWGSMIGYLTENLGVKTTGLTVSEEQAKYANERYDENCVTLVQDFREHDSAQKYDRIVSIGMFEHVGHRAYRSFFETAHRVIKDDGILLLHTITSHDRTTLPDAWLTTYIFPNSEIPTLHAILESAGELFRLEHAENLGGHNYDKTLMAWWQNFHDAYERGELDRNKYDKRFYRMWEIYLRGAAGNMRAEKMGVHQFKFRKI